LPAEQSQALAAIAERSMQLQVTVQDGTVWVGNAAQSLEITPRRLWPESRPILDSAKRRR
jgi:uncharacterized protein YaeQ